MTAPASCLGTISKPSYLPFAMNNPQNPITEIANMENPTKLEIAPIGVRTPRFDSYQRLLARFYEPLFLLRALGQTRGQHTPQPTNFDACMEKRRRFLQNLAFVCDFMKGGGSCTAIGLESCQTSYRFWVAANKMIDKIIPFLNQVLNILRGASNLPTPELTGTESALIRLCTSFATSRIREEHTSLKREVVSCISLLTGKSSRAGKHRHPTYIV